MCHSARELVAATIDVGRTDSVAGRLRSGPWPEELGVVHDAAEGIDLETSKWMFDGV